jgi:hypothetical protein
MKRLYSLSRLTGLSLAVFVALASSSMQSGPRQAASIPNQGVDNNYGVSGGNVNDISKRFCCSGTLGSLVTDGSNDYILSNNHILADSDQGHVGDAVSQPGLVDVNCNAADARIVANLSAWPVLGSNVDAALAHLVSGTMNTTGRIEGITPLPSTTVRTPAIGLAVEKSGRTTGVTTGSIQAVNASVNVRYTTSCGGHKSFTISYKNQVVVTPGTFSAGGDSGSLIVTNDIACPQPVALLFAGSNTSTIGNPIGEVISQAGIALGTAITFVGQTCGTATATQPQVDSRSGQVPGISDLAVANATMAMRTRERQMMSRPGVIGMGIGASAFNASEAVIVVYVDSEVGLTTPLPGRIGGVRVERIATDPFVAY